MAAADSEWLFPNAATPLGSGNYYAVRFSPQPQRDLNAMLLAWYDTIAGIALTPTDPGVARLKLDWWRSEITATLDEQKPRHPLMIGLSRVGLPTEAAAPMNALIDAAEERVRAPHIPDADAFDKVCSESGGRLFELFCASDPEPTYNTARARELGRYWEANRRLCLGPEDATALPATYDAAQLETLLRHPDAGSRLRDEPIPDIAKRLVAVASAMAAKLRRYRARGNMRAIERPPIAHLWTAWRGR